MQVGIQGLNPQHPVCNLQNSCKHTKKIVAQGLNPHFPVILPLFYTVSTVQILLCRPSSSVPAIKSIASIFRLAAFDAPTQRLSPFYLVLYILGLFCTLPCILTTYSGHMLFLCPGVFLFFCCPFSIHTQCTISFPFLIFTDLCALGVSLLNIYICCH